MAADLVEILRPYLLEQNPRPSIEKMEITLRLADAFQQPPTQRVNQRDPYAEPAYVSPLTLAPHELVEHTGIGTYDLWKDFLQLIPVQNYVKKRMAEEAEVAQRKGMEALQKEAIKGEVTAIRHLNEVTNYLNREQHNKIIILHQIARPKQ